MSGGDWAFLHPETVTFTVSQAGYTMAAILTRQSQDVLIQLVGGDVPHYGVVTTVDHAGQVTSQTLPSRPGHVHQETVLTERLAAVIAPGLQGNAFIVGGLHVNVISKRQLAAAGPMAQVLGKQVAAWLAAHPAPPVHEEFAPPHA